MDEGPITSSSGSYAMCPKRQVNTSIPPSLHPPIDTDIGMWSVDRMKKEITSLRTRLSQAESSIEIHKRMSELTMQQMSTLEMRLKTESDTIKQQQEDLEAALINIHKAREAQAAVELELSQVKASMHKRIEELIGNTELARRMVHSTYGLPRTSSYPQNSAELAQFQMDSKLQRDFERQTVELDQAKMTIKELRVQLLNREPPKDVLSSMLIRVQQLEKDLKNAMDLAAFAQEDQWPDQDSNEDDNLESSGNDETQVKAEGAEPAPLTEEMIKIEPNAWNDFPDTNESESHCSLSSDMNEERAFLPKATEHINPPSLIRLKQLKRKKSHGEVRTMDKRGSYFCTTNPKFFEIDWNQEYHRSEDGKKWKCGKCFHTYVDKMQMQDHIWGKHYGEKFQCACCTHRFPWRCTITVHLKKEHPELFSNGKFIRKIGGEFS